MPESRTDAGWRCCWRSYRITESQTRREAERARRRWEPARARRPSPRMGRPARHRSILERGRRGYRLGWGGRPRVTVEDVMTRPALVISPVFGIETATAIVANRQIRRLPVAREGQLVGIVSWGDLVKALATSAQPPPTCGQRARAGVAAIEPRGPRSLPPDRQHRTRGARDHAIRHAADEELGEPGAPVGAHHDEVDAAGAREADDVVVRQPLEQEPSSAEARLFRLREQLVELFLGE